MKIIIGQPPIPGHRSPNVMQNRQFCSFSNPTKIYPVVPATGATRLANLGHEVAWMDGVADEMTQKKYEQKVVQFKPDIIFWEVKTPTIKSVLKFSEQLKNKIRTEIVLFGDHVTALPFQLTNEYAINGFVCGGHYDRGMVDYVSNPNPPVRIDANEPLPFQLIDRKLTQWKKYAYANGNFKHTPGAYTMFGRDCWYRKNGGCTFCSWVNLYPDFSLVKVPEAMAEVESCLSLGVREIFDDTGTFPGGAWLHAFCDELRKINKGWRHKNFRLRFGCNLRANGLKSQDDYDAMGSAGFRFVLFGLESANEYTLKKINKGEQVGDLELACKMATKSGLEPHVTAMVGYPWETRQEAVSTIRLAKRLFQSGLIKTLQATICIPYPGTRLYQECKEKGWLKTEDWDDYDMTQSVMRCPMPDRELMALVRGIYKSCLTPAYLTRQVFSIRNIDDLKYLFRSARYLLSHLGDFQWTSKN